MDYAIPSIMEKTYTNPLPITNRGDLTEEQIKVNGDPFVMKYNGEYYCYSSGTDGVNLLHSTDLVHFEHLGFCLREEGAFDYWAPCVIYDNGRFYMYYSTNPLGEYDNHAHCLKLAVSDSPYGPFKYVKQFFDNFSIDPHVIKDQKGDFYIFYSVNNYSGTDRNLAGTIVVADKLVDFEHFEGKPFPVIMPSIEEEVFEENRFGDGRNWHTIEGAFYLEKGDNAYIMYSANCFINPTYFVGYTRAKKQGSLTDYKWEKYPDDYTYEPFINQNEKVGGTGHNSVVKAPNNLDDWIVYHGHEQMPDKSNMAEHRAMRIDPIIWGIGKMYTPAPSSEDQDAPAEPFYRNLYLDKTDREVFENGDWSIENSCLCQNSSNGITSMHLSEVSLSSYLLETNVKWIRHHFGGRYGIFAAYINKQNNVQVILNEGERCLEMYAVINGGYTESKRAPVGNKFDFKAFHKLTVKRTNSIFQVYLDDTQMLEASYAIGKSSVGMINYYTAAVYDSLELTEYLELNRRNGAGFLQQTHTGQRTLEKNWAESEGRLINYAVDSEDLFFSLVSDNYRFSVNMKQLYRKKDTYCGIYAAYFNEDNYRKVKLYQAEQKIIIETKEHGSISEKEISLEEKEMTTLYVKKYGSRIVIMLGRQMLMDEEIIVPAKPGCGLCSNVRTVFSEIELLGL